MQYTDGQRIEKIKATVDKLIAYVNDSNLTREQILEKETVRWTQKINEASLVNKGIADFEAGKVVNGKKSLKKLRQKHGI